VEKYGSWVVIVTRFSPILSNDAIIDKNPPAVWSAGFIPVYVFTY
jgi:hypothetical protein